MLSTYPNTRIMVLERTLGFLQYLMIYFINVFGTHSVRKVWQVYVMISNSFINKIALANKWMRFSCSNSALVVLYFLLISLISSGSLKDRSLIVNTEKMLAATSAMVG